MPCSALSLLLALTDLHIHFNAMQCNAMPTETTTSPHHHDITSQSARPMKPRIQTLPTKPPLLTTYPKPKTSPNNKNKTSRNPTYVETKHAPTQKRFPNQSSNAAPSHPVLNRRSNRIHGTASAPFRATPSSPASPFSTACAEITSNAPSVTPCLHTRAQAQTQTQRFIYAYILCVLRLELPHVRARPLAFLLRKRRRDGRKAGVGAENWQAKLPYPIYRTIIAYCSVV